ncbi:MAG: CRISPR-associated endonuclease Cas2 [bacterium]
MKLPLTDKFLWDSYCFFEKLGDVVNPPEIFKLKSWRDICCPEESKFWREYEKKKNKRQFGQFLNYLKTNNYIKIKNLEEGKGILLTSKGIQRALKVKYKLTPNLKKRKDKKWIMVIFDIPEKARRYRDCLRKFLYSLGFQKLQQSVWVSPYQVNKELEEIIRIHSLDKFIKIFLIEEVEI